MDGAGNLQANGIILIDGDLGLTGQTSEEILYTGKATILVTGDITINVDFLTKWFNTYPQTDLLGFMTPQTITFDKSQLLVMGIFYAEDTIVCEKQTSVAGTFFANYFDMGNNVPSIYQIPEAVNHLPLGLIGDEIYWVLKRGLWAER